MNASLAPHNRPPKQGAIFIAQGIPGFAAPGSWIEIDQTGGGVINLNSGARLALNDGRPSPRMFGTNTPPGVSDVHYPVPIAGYLSNYRQPGKFLLDELVQQQPVDFTQFKYRATASSDTFLVRDVRASSLSSPAQVQLQTSLSDGACEDLRVGAFLPYRSEQQADFPFLQATARVAWNALMLWREYQAFKSGGLFMTSSNWAASVRTALGADQNWGPPGSEGSDSNPIRDLRAARLASVAPITFWAMSLKQSDWFFAHPAVIDHYKAFQDGGITQGMIKQLQEQAATGLPVSFKIPTLGECLIHNARATTDPATAPSLFWPDDIVLGFTQSPSMPPNSDVASAITFRLKNPTDGAPGTPPPGAPEGVPTNNGWRVRMVPLPLIGSGGQLMVLDISEKTIQTSNDVGAYISGIS